MLKKKSKVPKGEVDEDLCSNRRRSLLVLSISLCSCGTTGAEVCRQAGYRVLLIKYSSFSFSK